MPRWEGEPVHDEARNIRQRRYYQKNKERLNKAQLEKRRSSDYHIALAMRHRARKRAMEIGVEFTIEVEDLLPLPKTCPCFGFPLVASNKKQSDNSFSLDRIDSSKGYTPDNIQIVSWKYNNIKSNHDVNDILKVAIFMEMVEAKLKKK